MSFETKRTFKESRCRLLEGNIFTEVLLQLKQDELLIQKKEYPKNFSTASTQLSNKVVLLLIILFTHLSELLIVISLFQRTFSNF